jgi:hypothetical protein
VVNHLTTDQPFDQWSTGGHLRGGCGASPAAAPVLVFLDDDYLGRAWCLAECGQYTRAESKCVIVVYGKAHFKPGSDFLGGMKAGVTADLPLIEAYILDKFLSKEAFNQAIDRAIVMLSPLSLLYQGRYSEAKIACEQEIRMLKDSKSENSSAFTKATVTLAEALARLGYLDVAAERLTDAIGMCAESELEMRGKILNGMGNVPSQRAAAAPRAAPHHARRGRCGRAAPAGRCGGGGGARAARPRWPGPRSGPGRGPGPGARAVTTPPAPPPATRGRASFILLLKTCVTIGISQTKVVKRKWSNCHPWSNGISQTESGEGER